ncbi:MAG: FAD-dependent thymidylate synthase [Christensenellales bacterium]|jgi:thymidylate synthase (FAD)
MPRVKPNVILIRHTASPEELVAMAAKLCYSKSDVQSLKQGVEQKDQERFLRRLMEMGHVSPIEHASFTFGIEGVSRSLLAQITRHRIASFSVQSQRYVGQYRKEGTFNYILPPAIEALGEDAVEEFHRQMATMQSWYNRWQERLGGAGEKSNEDARFVLPNAAETKMVVTMNARELLHFFSIRCCNRAQWELRFVAWQMLRLCRGVSPLLFEKAGPGCIGGPCPEGPKTCGKMAQVRKEWEALT